MENIKVVNVNDVDYAVEDTTSRQMNNRLYEGIDLAQKHAGEISGYSSVWAWIQARLRAGNFEDINVGDYIQFTAGGNIVIAEVAGINTYKDYGDVPVPNHIDFISRDCWPETRQWNKVNYNNGIATMTTPFLASDIYHWLNGLQGQVPNDATVAMTQNPTPASSLASVDYRATGLLPQLPAALRAAIIQKRELMPRRYAADLLLTDNNRWNRRDMGFLWLPDEMEIYGSGVWGGTTAPLQGYDKLGAVQYPLFAGNIHKRVKGAGNGGARSSWWLSNPMSGRSTYVALVFGDGHAAATVASRTTYRIPVCFRIA